MISTALARSRAVALTLGAALVALAGCAGDEPPVAAISVTGGDAINETSAGEATPVVVDLLALERASAFRSASFFELYDSPRETLGASLVRRERLNLTPGGTRERGWTLDGGASHIGAVAAFRDIDTATWRAVTPISDGADRVRLTVRVEGDTLTMSKAR